MKIWLCLLWAVSGHAMAQQPPCDTDTMYRQLDFWLGEWEAFNPNNTKAGDSRISRILGNCVILEEWTSASTTQGIRYAGKSFNTWNKQTRQWQQTWVDNVGGSTAFLKGSFAGGKMTLLTDPFPWKPDTMAIRKLSFYPLGPDKVRQHGEISKDNGRSWQTEYDLEYRRKQ